MSISFVGVHDSQQRPRDPACMPRGNQAKDLARWGDLLYSGGLLSDRMLKEMRTTVEAQLGPGSRYGLGLIQRPSESGVVIGHSGYFPGFLTDLSHYVEHDLTLVFQVNTTAMSRELNPPAIARLLDACAKAILD